MEKNCGIIYRCGALSNVRLVLCGFLAILLIGSCSTNRGGSSNQGGPTNQGSFSADLSGKDKKETGVESMAFPFVNVPTYITNRKDAAEYLARNFWNGYFVKAEKNAEYYSIDSVQFETAYANYAAILNMLGSVKSDNVQAEANYRIVADSQKRLFAKADSLYLKGFKLPLMRLIAHSEKYLYDPNSPYLNEETYIPALEAIMALESIDNVEKLAYRYQLKMALLNRVGTKANDFEYAYVAKGGSAAEGGLSVKAGSSAKPGLHGAESGIGTGSLKRSRLYKTKAEYMLIYFNNPDCNSCKGEQQALMSDPAIVQMCANGTLTVLAMYIDEQKDSWADNYKNIPDSWIYAHDPHLTLRDNELYGIRAIPSMYLLDKDKKVLLKDVSAKQVIEYMKEVNSEKQF